MSLQTRLTALIAAIGADVKALQAASGGSAPLWTPHYPMTPVPGALYFPVGGGNNTVVTTVNRLYYVPFTVSRAVRLASWGTEGTAFAAGSSLRSAIYNNEGGGDRPFAPFTKLVDASATVSTATTNGNKTFTPATTTELDPTKVYWFGIVAQGGAPTVRGRASSDPFVTDRAGTPTISLNQGYFQASVSGALPAQAAVITALTAGVAPAMFATFTELP